jgi:hypothetical protein
MPVRTVNMPLDIATLREGLGLSEAELPDDATDEQIAALLAKAGKAEREQPSAPANEPSEDGYPREWLNATERAAVRMAERRADEERPTNHDDAEFIRAAVRKGKLPAARAEHYLQLMSVDRAAMRDFVNRLPESLPVTEIGSMGSLDDPAKASDYPGHWLNPSERRNLKAAHASLEEYGPGYIEPGTIVKEL